MNALFVISLCLFLLGCRDETGTWHKRKFDEQAWSITTPADRHAFVRSLVEENRLLGLSHPQVVHMLGNPSFDDAEAGYSTYVVKADGERVHLLDIRYRLGDANRIVERAFVRSD
jgi:hypothetical protein